MPKYADGGMQIVALPEAGGGGASNGAGALVAVAGGGAGGGAIVEYKGGKSAIKPLDDEDLEVKLRRISEQVPVRISNTSGSSAGSGSGDFHQYRQMRRREQDRLARMEVDYQKRTAEREFIQRREERLREAEERTAKKRALRQKKKEKKKLKKSRLGPAPASFDGPQPASQPLSSNQVNNDEEKSDGSGDSDDDELSKEQERLGAPTTQLVAGGVA
ncbi:hypothetical protein M758_9G008100 [Ceratodon purpureus]|uniref:PRKR-interacting protein 1 n=1 Tax=Ceratodon purpureus TaxID=3225 RepID=A0A8T0GUX8_CERPU|nr:hypothetical protein KC19_9G008600 [Ceratodon purpureus]KAG0604792.1 hypothetical protein M758_9G008100 [Ceratodon purpureus]